MSALAIQLLLTGNELMSGDIVDSNSAKIAKKLKDIGIELKRKVTVSDDFSLLVEELTALSKQADIVIVNGGLGPTVDDLTAKALATAAGIGLAEHPEALAHLTLWCQKRKSTLSKQNIKQAILPEACEIIPNNAGSAVGFKVKINKCLFICTPGVPSELEVMLTQEIIPELTQLSGNDSHTTRLQVYGIGESALQKLIDEEIQAWSKEVELGFRANHEYLEVKLTTHSQLAHSLKAKHLAQLTALLGDHIFHHIDKTPITLEECVVGLLKKKGLSITTAESCTGGLIASKITSIAGSSAVFEAGIVTYSNKMKQQLLGVTENTLLNEGAVSKNCVSEMAHGALAVSGADNAIAVSGIAGPSGATQGKPVGTVCFAWGNSHTMQTTHLLLGGDRAAIQHTTSLIALDLIRRKLINSAEVPFYIKEKAM